MLVAAVQNLSEVNFDKNLLLLCVQQVKLIPLTKL